MRAQFSPNLKTCFLFLSTRLAVSFPPKNNERLVPMHYMNEFIEDCREQKVIEVLLLLLWRR